MRKEVDYMLKHGIIEPIRATGAHHAYRFPSAMDPIAFAMITER